MMTPMTPVDRSPKLNMQFIFCTVRDLEDGD